jgi:hypothetical protein
MSDQDANGDGDPGPEYCERCRAPINGRWFSLRIESDPSAPRALAVGICPKCLESLERWINRHLKPAHDHRHQDGHGGGGGEGIELGVGLGEPPPRAGSRSSRGRHRMRVNRRADLERQLDREVSIVNQNAFWVMGAIIVTVGVVAIAIFYSKIHSLLPNDTGPARPTVGAAEIRPAEARA